MEPTPETLTDAQKAELRESAQRHFELSGRQYKLAASDWRWRDYRKAATPAAILSLLAENTDLSARLAASKQELASAKAAKLDLLREFYAGNGPLGYDVEMSKAEKERNNGRNEERGRMRAWTILRAGQSGYSDDELREKAAARPQEGRKEGEHE